MKADKVVMLIAVIIIVGIILRNAAGSVAAMLAGGQAATGFVKALEGPAVTSHGVFRFGGNMVSI